MIKRTYSFAGRAVEVTSQHGYIHERCAAYRVDGPADVRVEIDGGVVRRERELYAAHDRPEQTFSDGYMEYSALLTALQPLLPDWDTLLFHASAVAVDGEGYLFAAKSGTGKSTHARYWQELFGPRAVIVNDDTPFLRLDGNGVTVYGSPWCGKHRLHANVAVPAKALCLLERSGENFITPITPREAFPVLYRQTCQALDGPGRQKELALLDALSKRVRLYRLGVNMSLDAARAAYQGINGGTRA